METTFNKSPGDYPGKGQGIQLNHCGISHTHKSVAETVASYMQDQCELGIGIIYKRRGTLKNIRAAVSQLMKVEPKNVSFVPNVAHGLSLIANGYPLEQGDEIISYVHEFPSNHYPWKLQERRGAKLVLLDNHNPLTSLETFDGGQLETPVAWDMNQLEALVSERTKIIALSHVQFTSGFAANLEELGNFCAERGIDLVIDAAQSMGCLPIFPERMQIAAVVSSGWKWLMGPVGTGVLYTSEEFRSKLAVTMVGPDMMQQGDDYLNHSWQPFSDGRMLEFGTVPYALAEGLGQALSENIRYDIESITAECFRLQQIIIDNLDANYFRLLRFAGENRSGILSYVCKMPPAEIHQQLVAKNIVCSSRGGYLRFAPHFCVNDGEVEQAVEIANSLAASF